MFFVDWATTTGRLLGLKMGKSIVFPKDTATRYRIAMSLALPTVGTKVSQLFNY